MGKLVKLRTGVLTEPKRIDLASLEPVMLFPDDADMQKKAFQSSVVQFARDHAHLLNQEKVVALVGVAHEATPLYALQRQTREIPGPYTKGVIAGEILTLAVRRISTNSADAAMKRVCADIAKQMTPIWPVSPKTIENVVWPAYRRVAHLWAAYLYLGEIGGDEYPFPCSVSDLKSFLAIAEAFRALAESMSTPKSRHTIQQPDETVSVATDIAIPPARLVFTPEVTQVPPTGSGVDDG